MSGEHFVLRRSGLVSPCTVMNCKCTFHSTIFGGKTRNESIGFGLFSWRSALPNFRRFRPFGARSRTGLNSSSFCPRVRGVNLNQKDKYSMFRNSDWFRPVSASRNHFVSLVEVATVAPKESSTNGCQPKDEEMKGKLYRTELAAGYHRNFPLVSVVDQDQIKEALLLGAVDHDLGGIVISGRRGTAKTVLARALQALIPPIEVVDGSICNADPENPDEWEDGLAEKLEGKHSIPTRIRDAPFIQIPLGVTEDRLVGTVDIEASIKQGKPVFQPGLLAEAHRGILYVDEINLLDDGIANLLLSIVSDGVNVVEREGISISHPCRPLLIATYNPDEGALREHLLDRIAITLSADVPFSVENRIDAVNAVTEFQDSPVKFLMETNEAIEELKTRILFAREFLGHVKISPKQVKYLVQEAKRGLVVGHRADVFSAKVAKACAALDGRDYVQPSDLTKAVELVILPRSTIIESAPPEAEEQMTEKASPPPPPPSGGQGEEQERDEEEEEPEEKEENKDEETQPQLDQIPPEFMFASEGVILDPDILAFALMQHKSRGKVGKSKQNIIYSEDRGRYVKSMFPKGDKVKRLAVDATLRAAAPYQKPRRDRAKKKGGTVKKVYIDKSDVRAKRLARKSGALVIFVVDASGSMALNRMAAAKGAVMKLLTESYTSRDYISLIPFYGNAANVLLPPSRSIALARNRLENLPCGGGTPLAHALSLAIRVGTQARKGGKVGRVMVVLITDGRANVNLSKSSGDPASLDPNAPKFSTEDLQEEVLDVAKILGANDMKLLVIDTESKFISSGFAQEIANVANGKYYYLPNASEAAVAAAAGSSLKSSRKVG